jgi:hypothetical protein
MSSDKAPPRTSRDDFDHWVSDMDDSLSRFLSGPVATIRERLDFTPQSLDTLEHWLLERYRSTKDMLASDQAPTIDGTARYIGETFRKAIGGHWDIELENPKDAYFGLPILTSFEPKPTPICPATLATTTADRRTGTFLRTILERTAKRIGKKLQD